MDVWPMCDCVRFEAKTQPASDSSEWLVEPDSDGWWWRYDPMTEVIDVAWSDRRRNFDSCFKWQRVKPHSPHPVTLPKSKTVTLTAKVDQFNATPTNSWRLRLFVDEHEIDQIYGSEKECRQLARDYGLEPTVEGDDE